MNVYGWEGGRKEGETNNPERVEKKGGAERLY